jgi:hypothetical protein
MNPVEEKKLSCVDKQTVHKLVKKTKDPQLNS